MSLNAAQTARVSAALHVLEEHLRQIDALVAASNQDVLVHMPQRLAEEQRQSLCNLAAVVREEIARIAERLALPCREHDQIRAIDALLTAMWVAMEEAGPKTLAGYGFLDPAAAEALTPELDRLIHLIARMRAVLQP